MKLIISLLTIFLIVIISCNKKKHINDAVSISQITTNYDTLIYRVKMKGNIDAYDELFYGFMDSNEAERTDSLMIYSKIMAEKYNYEKAYFDYLKAICEKFDIYVDYPNYSEINLSKMDSQHKNKL